MHIPLLYIRIQNRKVRHESGIFIDSPCSSIPDPAYWTESFFTTARLPQYGESITADGDHTCRRCAQRIKRGEVSLAGS